MPPKKVFATAYSTNHDWREAVGECASSLKKTLGKEPCDLLLFFVSEPYRNLKAEVFCRELADLFSSKILIGCNSSGVISGNTTMIHLLLGLNPDVRHMSDVDPLAGDRPGSLIDGPGKLEDRLHGRQVVDV